MRSTRTFLVLLGLLSLMAGVVAPVAAESPAAVMCGGAVATIVGTAADDVLDGTPGPDVIAGLGGNDTIDGKGGNDTICGNAGLDILRGGFGADRLLGGGGPDRIFGGAGADVIAGGGGLDRLFGGGRADQITGGAHADTINGGAGNDRLFGGAGNDKIVGGNGSDRLRGQLGKDVLDGSAGIDNCIGEIEYNCEVIRVGPRIDVFQGPENLDFPAGEPFHLWHGWGCDPAQDDCSVANHTDVGFQLFIDGQEVAPTDIEIGRSGGLWLSKTWVFNRPAGMSGVHTFYGVWTDLGVVAFERTITVNFS